MGRVLLDLWNIRGGFRLGAGLRHTHPELDPNTTKLQKYPNYTYITNFQTLINLILNSQFSLLTQLPPPSRLMLSLPLSLPHAHAYAHPHSHRPINPCPHSLSQLVVVIITSICLCREKSLRYAYVNFVHHHHDLYQILALF